jgi:hypothetical protein
VSRPSSHRRRSPVVRAEYDRRVVRGYAPEFGNDALLAQRMIDRKVRAADLHDARLQVLAPDADDRADAIRTVEALVNRIRRALKALRPPTTYDAPRRDRRHRAAARTPRPRPWPFDGPVAASKPQRAALPRSGADDDPDPPSRRHTALQPALVIA